MKVETVDSLDYSVIVLHTTLTQRMAWVRPFCLQCLRGQWELRYVQYNPLPQCWRSTLVPDPCGWCERRPCIFHRYLSQLLCDHYWGNKPCNIQILWLFSVFRQLGRQSRFATGINCMTQYCCTLFRTLRSQKRLAAKVLKCGKNKIWLDPNETNEISNANSRMAFTISAFWSLPIVLASHRGDISCCSFF